MTTRRRAPAEDEPSGLFSRLRETRSRAAAGRWRSSSRPSCSTRPTTTVWERLEEALIHADCGVPATVAVIERLEAEADAGTLATAEELSDPAPAR